MSDVSPSSRSGALRFTAPASGSFSNLATARCKYTDKSSLRPPGGVLRNSSRKRGRDAGAGDPPAAAVA
ncbi:MAG: hypothetical protein M3416_02325, partial [Acidobacteriota bacterium]|nr:hypothetical protein [Acidobacteriota bacterium]